MKAMQKSPDLGKAFGEAWTIYKDNFVLCFVTCLLGLLISSVSCGICGAPMFAGMAILYLRLVRGDATKPAIGDVFVGFQKFLPAFVVMLVLGVGMSVVGLLVNVVPVVGQLVSLVLSLAVTPAVTMLALCFVADQNAGIGEAIAAPFKLLGDSRFWSFALVCFVSGLVAAAGLLLCGIGMLFTMPFAYLIDLVAYEQMYAASPEALPEN